jgi:predicted Fe-Mo cluster-binding NifX family protein
MTVTYYVVVPFDWDDAGALSAGQAQEASNAFAAERGARAISHQQAGVVVFSRIGNPAIGEFQEAVILAQFGDLDLNALSEWRAGDRV